MTDQPARSYSQLNQWTDCPKQYELQRIHRVPRRPMVNSPAGTAVHKVIELWLRQKIQEGH
jgi:PD-(D/E)XK nuclease superfamily